LNYIGPFLRVNVLKVDNMLYQLFYLSKESLKHILLYSRCGIQMNHKEINNKLFNNDNNTFKSISPLLAVYKKASPILETHNNRLMWREDKFKKEILVKSNGLMCYDILKLYAILKQILNREEDKKLNDFYLQLAEKQLIFFINNLRNSEGYFVDKVQENTQDMSLDQKDYKFKFSDQLIIMNCCYLLSTLKENSDDYRNFALDIFQAFLDNKDFLYTENKEELLLCALFLKDFYKMSNHPMAKFALIDLIELLLDKSESLEIVEFNNKYSFYSSMFILLNDLDLTEEIEKFNLFKNKAIKSVLYELELGKGLVNSQLNSKEINYNSDDLMNLIIALMLNCKNESSSEINALNKEVYKKYLVSSGIILSWPEVPEINNAERYRNFSKKSEDVLDEQYFRLNSFPSPDESHLAPIFIKNIEYNIKKQRFKQGRISFDSNKNMYIYYIILNNFGDDYLRFHLNK